MCVSVVCGVSGVYTVYSVMCAGMCLRVHVSACVCVWWCVCLYICSVVCVCVW